MNAQHAPIPMPVEALRLLAGSLCLNYVNTVENRASAEPEDLLHSAQDVVRWGRHAHLLDATAAEQLQQWAMNEAAQAAFEHAIAVREALHATFLAVANDTPLPPAALATLQSAWAHVMRSARLSAAAEAADSATPTAAARWSWPLTTEDPGERGLDPVLGPVLSDALTLLTDARSDLARVKVCANPHGCGWLFYDHSRNGSRRWCSMEGCGSQVKMQRQYAKQKQRRAVGAS